MRRFAIVTAAALIAAAPTAYAGQFGGAISANEGAGGAERHEDRPSVLSAIISSLSTSVSILHAHSETAQDDERRASGNQCDDSEKISSNKTAQQHTGGEDADKTEPTGPEPIYFGF